MDFSAFVGLPWKDRGRTAEGYDCWGLFRTVFEAGTGVSLPSLHAEYSTADDRIETAMAYAGEKNDWHDVEPGAERAFDGALLRIWGGLHIGIIVSRGQMLHLPRGKTSVIEPISRYRDRKVLVGLYRHGKLLQ